jgi:hypothetical protein
MGQRTAGLSVIYRMAHILRMIELGGLGIEIVSAQRRCLEGDLILIYIALDDCR